MSKRLANFGPWVVLLGALGVGCTPQIGDECSVSTDCSAQGDRLCDGSQPGGYCTVFGCEPDGCPDNSVCVGFGLTLDPACEGQGTDPRWPRFERTFCLATCEVDDDCRTDYVCLSPEERSAESVDVSSEWRASKVCFPEVQAVAPQSGEPGVCAQ